MSQFTAILTSMFVGAGRGRVWVWEAASAGWPGPLAWLLASDRHCHGMGFSRVYETVLKEGLWEGVCVCVCGGGGGGGGGLPPGHGCRPWVAVACGLYSCHPPLQVWLEAVCRFVQVFRDSFN